MTESRKAGVRLGCVVLPMTALVAGALVGVYLVPMIGHADTVDAADASQKVCTLDRTAIFTNSEVAKTVNNRLSQLSGKIDKELAKDRKPLDQSIQAFRKQADSLSDAERKKQQAALQKRQQAYALESRQLLARLNYTRDEVRQRLNAILDPLLQSAYEERGCSLLLKRSVVLNSAQKNDLTPVLIRSFDAKVTSIKFGLMPLPEQKKASSGQKAKSG